MTLLPKNPTISSELHLAAPRNSVKFNDGELGGVRVLSSTNIGRAGEMIPGVGGTRPWGPRGKESPSG